jgi:Flp pilus assembly protein TadD
VTSASAGARAQALINLGRSGEAVSILSPAVAADPHSYTLVCLLSQAYLGSKDPHAALSAAQRATALAPNDEWGHRLQSLAYSELGDHETATRTAGDAVRVSPLEWRTHARLAVASAQAGHSALGRQAADEGVRLAPDEAGSHFALGYAAMKAGDNAVAEQAYIRTLSIEPNHASALNNLSLVRMKQPGGLQKAMKGFGAALTIDAQLEVAPRNLRVVARRYLRRFHYFVLAAYLVIYYSFSSHSSTAGFAPQHVSGSSRVAAGLVGACALLILLGTIVVFDRRVPDNLRRYYRRLPLMDRSIGIWLAVELAAMVTICLIAVPTTYGGRSSMGTVAWLFILTGVVMSWLPRLTQRKR